MKIHYLNVTRWERRKKNNTSPTLDPPSQLLPNLRYKRQMIMQDLRDFNIFSNIIFGLKKKNSVCKHKKK